MNTISSWVQRWAPLIPCGEVLDLACGSGRHARYLAALGHQVLALDYDPDVLQHVQGAGIATAQFDLEAADAAWPFAAGRFAGIVVTNYLHRPLIEGIMHSLAPDGVLIYETFSAGNAELGKPSNPAFLLQAGELLEWASRHGMRVVAFEDGRVETPKAAMVQRLCAVKSEFPPLAALLPPF